MEHFCFCLKNNPFSALSVGGLAFLLKCTYVPIYSSPFRCCFVHCFMFDNKEQKFQFKSPDYSTRTPITRGNYIVAPSQQKNFFKRYHILYKVQDNITVYCKIYSIFLVFNSFYKKYYHAANSCFCGEMPRIRTWNRLPQQSDTQLPHLTNMW